jgi:DNA-binding NarL/FixJ family response regulator
VKSNTMRKSEIYEEVCLNCPGSLWGEKSICRVHQKSIGDITHCEEWNKNDSPKLKSHDGQVAFFDLEPAIEIVQKTEEDLRSYHWVVREIDRVENELHKAIQINGPSSSLVAQYGEEAGMPKGKGLKLSTMSISEERYERQVKRLEKLKEKVHKINQAVLTINDDKERTVLECILDGERMNIIARHVGISRQRLNEIKIMIVKKMAWELYQEECKRN